MYNKRMNAKELHTKAEMTRELEQDFLKSLQFADEATLAYSQEGNTEGMAEIQGSRVLAFSHLAQKTDDKNYLVLAKHAAMAGVEIMPGAMTYFRLGKALEETEDFSEAVSAYKSALEYELPIEHNRPAVKSDLKAHLGFVEYLSGDKEQGLQDMDEAISELEENSEELKYNRDVWLSGAYMRKAVVLKDKEALEKARDIIYANPELVLRKGQLEKLASEI